MSSKQTILQTGTTDPTDLFVYCHIAATYVKEQAAKATRDAVVAELWGNGTSAYRPLLHRYGGSWTTYKKTIANVIKRTIGRSCLTTWSAGSQVIYDVCLGEVAQPDSGPDAIVSLDGIYGIKPSGARQGDGAVVMDSRLEAVAKYAVKAARGERIFVLFHSRISTTYGSSKETAEAIQAYVERETGNKMTPDLSLSPDELDGHKFAEALVLGNFHVVEFAGNTAGEHIREAHLFDEVWTKWIPWAGDEAPDEIKGAPVPAPLPTEGKTLPALALALSLAEEAAGVGETPPGSNKVKLAYWASTTRKNPKTGDEGLTKVTVGPWCAAAFQWATYEAARELGLGLITASTWTDPSSPIPHGRRISVIELQADFAHRGLFFKASDVCAGMYDPQPGDAVFFDRLTSSGKVDPTIGHVARFVRRINAETFETVGGNEAAKPGDSDAGDRWRRTVRRYDEKRLRGFGSFGVPGTATESIAAPTIELTETERADLSNAIALGLARSLEAWIEHAKPDEPTFDDSSA